MCVYVCLAKSGKTGRLVLAEALWGSGAVVDAEERRKSGFTAFLPDVLAKAGGSRQVRPPGRRDDDAGEESPARITGQEAQIRIFLLRVCPRVEHLTAAAFTCTRPLDYYLGDTWADRRQRVTQVRTSAPVEAWFV